MARGARRSWGHGSCSGRRGAGAGRVAVVRALWELRASRAGRAVELGQACVVDKRGRAVARSSDAGGCVELVGWR
jgi:hypothetical protein